MSDKSIRQRSSATHTTADEFRTHWAYFACAGVDQLGWLPFHQLRLPINDLGFRQGVTAVERLRTYSGRPFQVQAHLDRLYNTLRLIQIENAPPAATLANLIDELLARNPSLLESEGDLGITVLATPGQNPSGPATLAMHLNRIDHAAVSGRRANGQPVVLTEVVQPDERSWSRHAKVRCRLHYYLADSRARQVAGDAMGILQDSDGTWTESSSANIALVLGREIVWPPASRVLPGITQTHVRELAGTLSVGSSEQPLTLDLIRRADAMLLMGTDTGLWFAAEIFGPGGETVFPQQVPGQSSLVRRLQRAWHGTHTAPPA